MARVFVEEALNRTGVGQFMLIQMAAKRAKELTNGALPMVEVKPGTKKSVIALKEIEEGYYTEDHFMGKLKTQFQLDQEQKLKEEEELDAD